MFPCIAEPGCSLFVTTADQRYLLGETSFMRTHFPANMKRFLANGKVENWQEDDVKRVLLHPKGDFYGNRTIVLYGAAGSGKSEMIRWLWHEMKQTRREQFVVRISRTELDPVQIIHKILTHYKLPGLDTEVLSQWTDMRKKPVTLANHLVWAALGSSFASDEEIIPMSYKLRPIVEKNLQNSLCGTEGVERGIELISLEELQELAQQCFIPDDVDLEQIRFQMLRELEYSIMGGFNFVDSLRMISAQVEKTSGQRPMLLVDDLVQSLNIYATDLLDYFITMEEGNWDIVLGLTPASFATSERGNQLLNRINNLDTFDDRILKLWISDEQGNDSFVVSEANCHLFAAKYLDEYKRMNGFVCNKNCSFHSQCSSFRSFVISPELLPLNGPLLRRIYRSLPRGKGKPRYFLREIGEILRKMAKGDLMGALDNSFLREFAADHPDAMTRLLIESYVDDGITMGGSHVFEVNELKRLCERIDGEDTVINVDLTSIMFKKNTANKELSRMENMEIDPGKMAIRDWLNAGGVNKELLKGLRQGTAHFLREAVKPTDISLPFTARLSSMIKWEETQEGSKIPLSIEGIDQFEGIKVSKNMGHCAYEFNYLHLRRGRAKEEAITTIIQNDSTYDLILKTQEYNKRIQDGLQKELGMPADEFSYHLLRLLLELRQDISEIPPVIGVEYDLKNKYYPQQIRKYQMFFSPEEVDIAYALFKDWFLLRENIYDGIRLKALGQHLKKTDPLEIIDSIDSAAMNQHYLIGRKPLGQYISGMQTGIKNLKDFLDSEETKEVIKAFMNIQDLLNEMQYPMVHSEASSFLAYINSHLGIQGIVVPDWQECSNLRTRIFKSLKGYRTDEGGVRLKSYLETHRFLLKLGDLENDPICQAMLAIYESIGSAQRIIELQYSQLKTRAVEKGLNGYFKHPDKNETEVMEQIDLAKLEVMALAVKGLINDRQRLNNLETSLPYIDHNLADAAAMTAEELKVLLGHDLPEWFTNNIRTVICSCTDYAVAIKGLMDTDTDMSGRYSVSQLAANHNKLSGNGLKTLINSLRGDWYSYITRRNHIIDIVQSDFKMGDLPGNDKGNGGNFDPAPILAEHLTAFVEDTLVPLEINKSLALVFNERPNQYLSLIEILLQNKPPEIEVNTELLSDLSMFFKDFKGLEKALLAKIYLKQEK